MRGWIVSIILFLVGLLNVTPVVVFFDPSKTGTLYGVKLEGEGLSILMRHRGVLLGLVGFALIFAAFRKEMVVPATIAAFISKFAFLYLTWTSPGFGPEIRQVAMFDIGAVLLLVIALIIHMVSR